MCHLRAISTNSSGTFKISPSICNAIPTDIHVYVYEICSNSKRNFICICTLMRVTTFNIKSISAWCYQGSMVKNCLIKLHFLFFCQFLSKCVVSNHKIGEWVLLITVLTLPNFLFDADQQESSSDIYGVSYKSTCCIFTVKVVLIQIAMLFNLGVLLIINYDPSNEFFYIMLHKMM